MRSQASNTLDHLVLKWEIITISSLPPLWGLNPVIAAGWNAIIQMILVSFSHIRIGDNIFIILIGQNYWSLVWPERDHQSQWEDGHEKVADGEDVGRHREGGGGVHQHVELQGEGESVEEGGHDGDGEAGGEEGAAETGV